MPDTSYQVTIGERLVRVVVKQREGDRVLVSVNDGPDQPVQLTTVHAALRSLTLGDRTTELMAALDGGEVALALGGQELRAEVVDEARARLASVAGARAQSHGRRELKAPMPGLVVKLLCQTGDVVEAGQPLVVLQAMKMENELSLPRGGTIKSVGAQPGQSVEQGQTLIVLE